MFVFSTDLCFRALYFISNNECLHLVFVYNISHVEKEIGEKWEFKSKCSSCETCTQHKLITANYSLDTGVIDRFKEVDIVSGSQKLMCKCLKPEFFFMSSWWQLHWLQKGAQLFRGLWENDPIFDLVYYLSKWVYSLNH